MCHKFLLYFQSMNNVSVEEEIKEKPVEEIEEGGYLFYFIQPYRIKQKGHKFTGYKYFVLKF